MLVYSVNIRERALRIAVGLMMLGLLLAGAKIYTPYRLRISPFWATGDVNGKVNILDSSLADGTALIHLNIDGKVNSMMLQ